MYFIYALKNQQNSVIFQSFIEHIRPLSYTCYNTYQLPPLKHAST